MKKKFYLIMSVFLFIFTTTIPVAAEVEIAGRVFVDAYYYHQDKEGFGRTSEYLDYPDFKTQPGSGGIAGIPEGSTTAAEDRNQTYFDLNHATHLRFHWRNQEGLGALTVAYMNADPSQSVGTDPGFNVGVSVAVLYYYLTKDFRLSAGKGGSEQVFSPFDPETYMGYDGVCKVEALGYGNINSKYQNNIRLTYGLNDAAKLDLALLMPRLTADEETMGGAGFVPIEGTAIDNVSSIPKVELGIPMTFNGAWGKLTFTPSAMYLKQDFSNVASGDDSITSYGLSAGASLEISGLRLMAEYNYGQNLYNAARVGEATVYPFKYEFIVGGLRNAMGARVYDGSVHDATTNAGWVQLGYNIADKIEPTLFYGRNNTTRDMPSMPTLGYGDSDFTTQMYGVNLPIKWTENLTIVPECIIYDNGDSNEIDGITYDFGKEFLAGLQMQLAF